MKIFGRTPQLTGTNAYRLIPWAWSIGWFLAGLGIWLSDVTSSPDRSPVAYLALGAVGWGMAALMTISGSRGKVSPLVQLAAWAGAAWVAIVLGLAWLQTWNNSLLGFSLAIGAAGAIGGIVTSLRPGLWRLVSGMVLGGLFFVFAYASLFATYLFLVLYTWISQRFGNIPLLDGLAWLIPGAVFGLCAGFALRWILGLHPINSTSPPA